MYALLLVTTMALVPHTPLVADRADVVEVNHYYDERGSAVFDQLIFWDWWDSESDYRVFAWRLLKSAAQEPLRDWQRGGYTVRWLDGNVLREVRSGSIRETWTQFDPEVQDRDILPPHRRRGLSGEYRYKIKVRVTTDSLP
jgi:hypothetical protein